MRTSGVRKQFYPVAALSRICVYATDHISWKLESEAFTTIEPYLGRQDQKKSKGQEGFDARAEANEGLRVHGLNRSPMRTLTYRNQQKDLSDYVEV